jgi:V-type H+-transporting ATPase subunit a
MFLAKEKALYRTLNMMKVQNQSFIGYFWAPIERENEIRNALSNFTAARIMAYDNHNIAKPTYFKTTDFSYVFQLIVDTYGVPTYLEANPAVVSMVTFPFFFGMMFGDMGHGSIVLLAGLYLTLMNDRLKGSAIGPFLPFRYMLLLMGIMATYCGFIYNEFFALPTDIFNTCFDMNRDRWNTTSESGTTVSGDYIYYRNSIHCVYPAGQDPAWGLASNRLSFINGVKMKMSVIFGVFHMTIGIIIKGTNSVYFKRYVELFAEVCTGIVILLGLFGWMDALIIAKWFTPVDIQDDSPAPVNIFYDTKGEDANAGDN